MKRNTTLIIVIALIVGLAGGFIGGMKYQQSKVPSRGQFGGFTRNGNNSGPLGGSIGQGRFQGGRGGVFGEIIGKDANSITVKMQDGSSKIVLITSSTSINKASSGSIDDLKQGEQVAVFGTSNSDGSQTAQNVQINPQLRGPVRQSQSPSTTPTP